MKHNPAMSKSQELLCTKFDPSSLAASERDALFKACSLGQVRLARIFIEGGISPNIVNSKGQGLLTTAVMSEMPIEAKSIMMEYLVRAGANINFQDKEGKTALIHATQSVTEPSVVALMLQNGADPEIVDNMGKSYVDYAWQVYSVSTQDFIQSLLSGKECTDRKSTANITNQCSHKRSICDRRRSEGPDITTSKSLQVAGEIPMENDLEKGSTDPSFEKLNLKEIRQTLLDWEKGLNDKCAKEDFGQEPDKYGDSSVPSMVFSRKMSLPCIPIVQHKLKFATNKTKCRSQEAATDPNKLLHSNSETDESDFSSQESLTYRTFPKDVYTPHPPLLRRSSEQRMSIPYNTLEEVAEDNTISPASPRTLNRLTVAKNQTRRCSLPHDVIKSGGGKMAFLQVNNLSIGNSKSADMIHKVPDKKDIRRLSGSKVHLHDSLSTIGHGILPALNCGICLPIPAISRQPPPIGRMEEVHNDVPTSTKSE